MTNPSSEDIQLAIRMIKEQLKDRIKVEVSEDIYSINDEDGHHWLRIIRMITDHYDTICDILDENPKISEFMIAKSITMHAQPKEEYSEEEEEEEYEADLP